MDILCGIEWDLLSEGTPKGFDYWIGSAHHLYGKTLRNTTKLIFAPRICGTASTTILMATRWQRWKPILPKWRRSPPKAGYSGTYRPCQKAERGRQLFDEESPRYKAAALRALQAARENDCILEVNTGGVYRGYRKDFYPGAWLLGEWNKLGGRVIITADAHDTAALTFGFDEAAAAIKAAGFTALTVLTVNGFEQQEL